MTKQQSPSKILIVQSDHTTHLEERLKNLGYTVCATLSSGQQAIEKAATLRPDLALIDLELKGEITGLDVAEQIGSRMPVIYLMDEVEEGQLQQAQATHPFGCVLKPYEERQLHLNIQTALSMHEREKKQRETENELYDQIQLTEAIFDSMSDGVIVTDEHRKILLWNSRAQQIGGVDIPTYHTDQWVKEYGFFLPDRETPLTPEASPLRRAINGEATDNVEIFIRNAQKPDGVYTSVSGRPLLRQEGISKGAVLIIRDITDQMNAEEALTRAFAQGRLEIVDTILHNIGNAINSVTVGIETLHQNLINDPSTPRLCALADAIKEHRDNWVYYISNDPQGQKVMPFIIALAEDFTGLNERLVKVVTRVKDRADHIADIIHTQKAFGSPNMDRRDIHLKDAFSSAIQVLQESLDKSEIETVIDCENAPQEIRIQENKFHQMMVNLIKNSIEAIDDLAASGGIEETPRIQIRAYVEEDFLYLDVSDNGIGIERENFNRIFSAGYTTKESGSGLGLHSAANFVIGSGGQIRPLSDGIGKGTTMRILLRLSAIMPQTLEIQPE